MQTGKSAITSMKVPPKVWERYVNDRFVIIKKESVSEFQDKLNSIDPMISFTIEKENNYQISFSETLVTSNNVVIIIEVFRKPTHAY